MMAKCHGVLPPLKTKLRSFEALKAEGLLCKETHEHVIRFAPPLIINKKELDWAFERAAHVFKQAE